MCPGSEEVTTVSPDIKMVVGQIRLAADSLIRPTSHPGGPPLFTRSEQTSGSGSLSLLPADMWS